MKDVVSVVPYIYANTYCIKSEDNFQILKKSPVIVDVIFRYPHTIVNWSDGTKTVVKCKNDDWDDEKGLAMAIVKKFMSFTKFENALENAVVDNTISRKTKKELKKLLELRIEEMVEPEISEPDPPDDN